MVVKVKKARTNTWSGLKAYAGALTKIGAPIDRNGYVVTGLSKEDEIRLEEALGMDKGHLRKGTPSNPGPYWVEYTVDIEEDKILTLDTENPDDELKYLFLKAQKKVANGMTELANNANAIFVIYSEEEEAIKENKRGKNKRLAYTLFDSMSLDDMKNVLMLYGRPSDSSSAAVVENTLQKFIEDDATTFLGHAKDPKMKMKVFILQLTKAGVLQKKGSAYVELGSEDVLAYDMDTMIEYLEAKTNNSKLLQFKQALKNKE